MVPIGEDEFKALTEQVRQHNSVKIRELLAGLEPYVDGSYGPVNPAHVRAYLEALKALGQLWRVFDKPEAKAEVVEVDEELIASAARTEVLAELAKLRELRGRRP